MMTVALVVLLCIDAFVILATVLPLLPLRAWWARAGEFPRLQVAFLALAALALHAMLFPTGGFLHWAALPVLAALVYQSVWIIPYTPVFPREVRRARQPVDRRRTVSVLVANVLMSNRNVASLQELIDRHAPDIVLLLETNAWWEEQMRGLRQTHPYGMDCALENRYGMHLYSRLPMEKEALQFLVEEEVPSMHAIVQMPSGERVRFHALHPAPPSPTENETSRERDAELVAVARRVKERGGSVIVTGDFNDVAWSPTTRLFRKISRLLDPRIGRGLFSTFPAHVPLMRWPLDHVFHSDDFTLIELKVLARFGSDHLPIFYRLHHEPSARSEQEAPAVDAEDHAEAQKLMNEGE